MFGHRPSLSCHLHYDRDRDGGYRDNLAYYQLSASGMVHLYEYHKEEYAQKMTQASTCDWSHVLLLVKKTIDRRIKFVIDREEILDRGG